MQEKNAIRVRMNEIDYKNDREKSIKLKNYFLK